MQLTVLADRLKPHAVTIACVTGTNTTKRKNGFNMFKIDLTRFAAAFAICVFTASLASAAGIRVEQTPGGPAGFVMNDVFIDAPAGDRIGALQTLLTLSSGSIFQFTTVPSDVRPSAGIIGAFPDAAFDTFVAAGQAVDGATPLIFGASDKLGGPGGPADLSGNSRLDATFSPAAGQNTLDAQNFLAARITLSEDAMGDFAFLADFVSMVGEEPTTMSIVNGVIGGGVGGEGPVLAGGGNLSFIFSGEVQQISLSNTGDEPLTFADPQFAIAGPDAANWSLLGTPDFSDIPAGGSRTFDLGFNALGQFPPQRDFEATLEFLTTNDTGNQANVATFNLTATVPEPSTVVLAGLGLAGVVGLARRRK